MRNLIITASLLLVAQLALVAAGQFGSRETMSATPESPFVAITLDTVTSLEIAGSKNEKLRLEKKDNRWLLPDRFNAPADNRQVSTLLDKVAGLRQGFVVASSPEAAQRFKVADDEFERHLVVRQGDAISAEFYTGTSPAFRQVHARKAGDSSIVAIDLSSYDLDTAIDKWLDKQVLEVAEEDLAAIKIDGLTIKRQKKEGEEATWLPGEDQKGTLDSTAVGELAKAIGRLIVLDVINPQELATTSLVTPELTFTVHTIDNRVLTFSFVAIDDQYFAVKRSDIDLIFKTGKTEVETLRQFNREKLLRLHSPSAATGGGQPADNPVAAQPAPQPAVPGN